MGEIISSKFIIRLISIDRNIALNCPDDCWLEKGRRRKECSYIKNFDIGNSIIKVSIIKLLIKNISDSKLEIRKSDFSVIDDCCFLHETKDICKELFIDNRFYTNAIEIPPNSQVKFRIITDEFEDDSVLCRINFSKGDCYTMNVQEFNNEIITNEEAIKVKNARQNEENCKMNGSVKSNYTSPIDSAIKYRTEEDDDYFYIISDEKDQTVTFHRRFNLSKSNYNWIDVGDPLITILYDDNTLIYIYSQLNSPVSGIFEFGKKQFIKYNEIICKIRKYSIEEKDSVFLEQERKAIKDSVLIKERKKQIEREALDELISEGLVFNTYIDKNGNRNRIPNDVANAVWNRDGGKCCECGCKESLEFDHIIPVSKGGATTYQNLQILCKTCNIKKSNKIG